MTGLWLWHVIKEIMRVFMRENVTEEPPAEVRKVFSMGLKISRNNLKSATRKRRVPSSTWMHTTFMKWLFDVWKMSYKRMVQHGYIVQTLKEKLWSTCRAPEKGEQFNLSILRIGWTKLLSACFHTTHTYMHHRVAPLKRDFYLCGLLSFLLNFVFPFWTLAGNSWKNLV